MAIEAHKLDVIVFRCRAAHTVCDVLECRAFVVGCTACGKTRHQPLKLATDFQQLQLPTNIQLTDQHAPTRQDRHKALVIKALQRLPDRRTANAQTLDENSFGQHFSRPQL